MQFSEYQAAAAETAIFPGAGAPLGLLYCALGLSGEAGEVAEKIKKAIRDDGLRFNTRPEDIDAQTLLGLENAIATELGDVLWYIAMIADQIGFDLNEIAAINLRKLASRKARGVLGGSGDAR